MTRRDLLLGGAGLLGVAGAWSSLKSRSDAALPKAPEFQGAPESWLNTDGKALKLYGDKGLLAQKRIVLADFWEYTCVNCIRTLPYLRAWDKRYRDLGLTIVGIHTPEFAFAKQKPNVSAAVQKFQLTYPILVDSQYANWNAYDNHYWPMKYLITPDGKIVYTHAGEGGYGETEARIQRWIKAYHPDAKMPPLMAPIRDSDKPGSVCYPQTPETYCGYLRGTEQFGSPGGFARGALATYAAPDRAPSDGLFYASGVWRSLPESIRHGRETKAPFDDFILLPYRALEANAVIKPEGDKPFDLYLLQDGAPIAKTDKGADVRYDSDGLSYVHVDAPRMYQLIKNKKWGAHELRLGSTSPDFGLYSFTFSSCVVGGTS